MLKRLYDLVYLFKEYLVFALFFLLSITLLALNDTIQIRAIRSMTIVSIGFLQDAFLFLPNYLDLRRENQALRELNVTLGDEVSRLREAHLENIRLRRLLELKEREEFRYVGANVVGRTMQPLRSTITLDVGSTDGVRVNMPIVNENGLVGKVVATGSHYAVGQLLLNKDSRVSAKVQRSRVDGIIRWEGGKNLILHDVAKTLDVQIGDLVITSEYSSLFPPGLKIGVVSSTHQIPGMLFQAVDVTPSVDFMHLEEVFVVSSLPDSGRAALERRFKE